jgi:hypothetical protein
VLFFAANSFLIQSNRRVLGVSVDKGVQRVVEPTLGAVNDTQQAVRSLNALYQIAADGAAEQLEAAKPAVQPGASFLQIFLPTFNEVLAAERVNDAPPANDPDVVRF